MIRYDSPVCASGNGNTLTKVDASATTTYTWDYENRLTQVTLPGSGGTVSFTYDSLGRRIRKIAPTTTIVFAYDGTNIVEETDSNGNAAARYAMGLNIDEPLAILRSSATHFYNADGLGSITSLTDGSGSIVSNYAYDNFGNLASSSGSISNPFRYTGREWDSETGLYFYRSRYYGPAGGRFVSEDSWGHTGVGSNFYPYVLNNPVLFGDPFGHCPTCVEVAAPTAAGAAAGAVAASAGGSTPVFILVASGSGEGAAAGPVGALVGAILVLAVYDGTQLAKLIQAEIESADESAVKKIRKLVDKAVDKAFPPKPKTKPKKRNACDRLYERCLDSPWKKVGDKWCPLPCSDCRAQCENYGIWPIDVCPVKTSGDLP